MQWRLIITPQLDPRLNMALDESLLNTVRPDHPVLRLYSWNPPGISLGHFQRVSAQTLAQWRRRGYIPVRRLTGGGAVVHRDDLTYSIVIADLAELGLSHHLELYDRVHAAFALALRPLGVTAELRGGPNLQRHTFFCSERPSAHDLMCAPRPWRSQDRGARPVGARLPPVAGAVAGRIGAHSLRSARHAPPHGRREPGTFRIGAGGKLMGSAQRRRGRAMLQHGSLLLADNPDNADSGVVSVSRAARRTVRFEEFADLLKPAFAETFSADIVQASCLPEELEPARLLATRK